MFSSPHEKLDQGEVFLHFSSSVFKPRHHAGACSTIYYS